jgi:hypothetical protein
MLGACNVAVEGVGGDEAARKRGDRDRESCGITRRVDAQQKSADSVVQPRGIIPY